MSKAGRSWSLKLEGFRPSHKLTLIVLGDIHNERTGRCFPSKAKIAALAGLSMKQIDRVLRELEANGMLKILSRRGHRGRTTSNEYLLPFMDEFDPNKDGQNGGELPDNMSTKTDKVSAEKDKMGGSYIEHKSNNSKKEHNNELTKISSKEKSGEKLTPEKNKESPPIRISMPDYETRCRWARGEWTDHEINGDHGEGGDLHNFYKKTDRKKLPDWLNPYHQHSITHMAELMKQYNR
jgi:hypothetical protein